MGELDARPGKWLPIDVGGARVGIDYAHHEIHDGNHYTVSYSKAISAGSVISVAITTPTSGTGYVHFTGAFQSSLSGTFVFSQNASISSGSALNVFNNNLNSAKTSGTVVVGTPTVTTYGTAITTVVIGTNDKQTSIGGGNEARQEFILATNSTYIIYFTANATSTYSSINLGYYLS